MKKKSTPPSSSDIKRVVFYGRLSTDEQAKKENNSLEAQEAIADQYIDIRKPRGWQKIRSILDPGYSAKDFKRPGMQELIELIRANELDIIIVYKLDRLTRSIRDFYDLWKLLEEHRVEFVSATEEIDTNTAVGRAILNMLLTFAQFEREQTSQRLCDKFAEEARKGIKHPGMAPYGYKLDKKNRSMLVEPDESKFVKIIFEMMVKLKSPKAVADAVNAMGARTKQRIYHAGTVHESRIGGQRWTCEKIKRLIMRSDYKGVRVHNGVEYKALWEPIVSEKLWSDANIIMASRDPGAPISTRNKHELAMKGILKCGHCGCSMSPKPGGRKTAEGEKRPYYTCQDVIRHGADSTCNVRNLPGKDFDEFVTRCIGEFGRHPDIIKATIKGATARQKKSIRPLKSQLTGIRKQIKQLDDQLKNCLSLAKQKGVGRFTTHLLREADELSQARHLADIESQKIILEIELIERSTTDEKLVAEALRNFKELFQVMPFEDRLSLMSNLIREIRVSKIDPKKIPKQLPAHSFTTQLRTQWYKIEFDFFIKSLFRTPSTSSKSRSQSSHLASNGGE